MITYNLKLQLNKKQEIECDRWLYHLASVYNWASRKVQLNARNGIYLKKFDLNYELKNHSSKLGISAHTLCDICTIAWTSWQRCFRKISKAPKLKGNRNKLTYIPFPDVIDRPKSNYIRLPTLGLVKFHKKHIPPGKIKCARIIKKTGSWFLCLFIDGEPNSILRISSNKIGIDPGFTHLLVLSNGDKIEHPKEFENLEKRLGQAKRGKRKKLSASINYHITNKRKDRNHKLSRKLISENIGIAIAKDDIAFIAKKFGKSVASAAHSKLRHFLQYKSPKSGTEYVEVDPKTSTKTCSACGNKSGSTGWKGLKVRHWKCPCGAEHDRDINAAINIFNVAFGYERRDGSKPVRNLKNKRRPINCLQPQMI